MNNSLIKENQIHLEPHYRVEHVIKYSMDLFKKGHSEIQLFAYGKDIGKLVVIVECLKTELPGIFQNYLLDSMDQQNDFIPQMRVILKTSPFKYTNQGFYKNPINEQLRHTFANFGKFDYSVNTGINHNHQRQHEPRQYHRGNNQIQRGGRIRQTKPIQGIKNRNKFKQWNNDNRKQGSNNMKFGDRQKHRYINPIVEESSMSEESNSYNNRLQDFNNDYSDSNKFIYNNPGQSYPDYDFTGQSLPNYKTMNEPFNPYSSQQPNYAYNYMLRNPMLYENEFPHPNHIYKPQAKVPYKHQNYTANSPPYKEYNDNFHSGQYNNYNPNTHMNLYNSPYQNQDYENNNQEYQYSSQHSRQMERKQDHAMHGKHHRGGRY